MTIALTNTRPSLSALAAEFTGTLWLVPGGCGSALLAAGFPSLGLWAGGRFPAASLAPYILAQALGGAALAEVVIMGGTDAGRPAAVAPLAIGLCLTLIHLISILVDNTSVNPARSTATALFAGGVLGGLLYRGCFAVRAGEVGDVGESL